MARDKSKSLLDQDMSLIILETLVLGAALELGISFFQSKRIVCENRVPTVELLGQNNDSVRVINRATRNESLSGSQAPN